MTDLPKKDPNAVARMLYEAEQKGAVIDCPKCGWSHRSSVPCPATKWKPEIAHKAELAAGEVDPIEKFQAWADRAKQEPTVYTATNRKCPGCQGDIFSAKNFLGVWFDVIGEDHAYLDDHQAVCCKPVRVVEEPMELVRPDRPRRDLD